jgi:gas vesicle protein GvpN
LPALGKVRGGYVDVHPQFRAIFTSNPEEYAGAHKTPDALMDRLITMNLGHYDRDTEVRITVARSGIVRRDAEHIVDIVRELRNTGVNNHRPTLRACIAIASILAHRGARAQIGDDCFHWACHDVLNVEAIKVKRGGQSLMPSKVEEIMRKVCGSYPRQRKKQTG